MFGCCAAGFVIIKYSRTIQSFFGKSLWAEQTLGPGGTQNIIKLVGIIVVFWGVFNWAGGMTHVEAFIQSFFGGM